jgi:hypothetical protein
LVSISFYNFENIIICKTKQSHKKIENFMYTLLSELYTKYCGYPEYNLAILGLEQTGKTVFYLLNISKFYVR